LASTGGLLASASAFAAPQTTPASAAPVPAVVAETQRRLDAVTADVDREYLIGPGVAADLGYRVVWQAHLPAATPITRVGVGLHGIYVLDATNTIARLRPSDGELLWRVAVANPIDIFRGVTWADVAVTTPSPKGPIVTREPRAYLSTDTECFVIDPNSGSMIDRQRFVKLPATDPLSVGPYLVYGTIGGQVVWHQCVVGHELHANSLDSNMRGKPVRLGDSVIAASERGLIMAMDASTGRTRWTARTLGGVLSTPAVGDGMVYVPSEDQYLWAFDGKTGAANWRYFTQSSLTTPPYAVGDSVLQYVPDEGLVCLASRANGKLDGVVRWKNPDVSGVPYGMVGNNVLLWDETKRVLTLLDPVSGSVLSRHSLPQVDQLLLTATGPLADDIFGLSKDGRVVRLTPKQARSTAATPDAAPAVKKEIPLSIPLATPDGAAAGSAR